MENGDKKRSVGPHFLHFSLTQFAGFNKDLQRSGTRCVLLLFNRGLGQVSEEKASFSKGVVSDPDEHDLLLIQNK
jgi:hypothetical protein